MFDSHRIYYTKRGWHNAKKWLFCVWTLYLNISLFEKECFRGVTYMAIHPITQLLELCSVQIWKLRRACQAFWWPWKHPMLTNPVSRKKHHWTWRSCSWPWKHLILINPGWRKKQHRTCYPFWWPWKRLISINPGWRKKHQRTCITWWWPWKHPIPINPGCRKHLRTCIPWWWPWKHPIPTIPGWRDEHLRTCIPWWWPWKHPILTNSCWRMKQDRTTHVDCIGSIPPRNILVKVQCIFVHVITKDISKIWDFGNVPQTNSLSAPQFCGRDTAGVFRKAIVTSYFELLVSFKWLESGLLHFWKLILEFLDLTFWGVDIVVKIHLFFFFSPFRKITHVVEFYDLSFHKDSTVFCQRTFALKCILQTFEAVVPDRHQFSSNNATNLCKKYKEQRL